MYLSKAHIIKQKERNKEMTNAEKFQEIFKKFATEVWAFTEKDFLTWLNAEYEEPNTKNNLGVDCNNCKNNVYKGDGIAHCATDDGMCHFESKTEDYISRDAVKYYIQEHIHEIITESGIDKNAHTNGILRDLLNEVNTMPSVTPQEPTEKIHSKTCGTCRYFRKHRNERNIEICKELYGENTICGHCTYWEDTYEVALPTIEYDYCSHHREVEE